jgi:hypothetical protein
MRRGAAKAANTDGLQTADWPISTTRVEVIAAVV